MKPRILALRPAPNGAGNTLARFDVQLDGIRLYNLALKQTGAGYRVFAPSAFGSAIATFIPEIATGLVDAALGEIDQHDRSRPAA